MRRLHCRVKHVVADPLGWWLTPRWAWNWYKRGGWKGLRAAWHHATGGNTCR